LLDISGYLFNRKFSVKIDYDQYINDIKSIVAGLFPMSYVLSLKYTKENLQNFYLFSHFRDLMIHGKMKDKDSSEEVKYLFKVSKFKY